MFHEVQTELGTRLSEILPMPVMGVNSHHHEGVWRIGAGLGVAARTPDGLVEAVELQDHSLGVAVQWHPERLPDQPHTPRLLRRFVYAAAEFHERAIQGWST